MVGTRKEKIVLMIMLAPLYWLRHNLWLLDHVPMLLAVTVVAILAVAFVMRQLVPRPLFVSLPYSHYVELARWAMDIGVRNRTMPEFTELTMPIGIHLPVFSALRLLFPGGLSALSSYPGSNVEHPCPWYDVVSILDNTAWLRRLSGTPALITVGGNVLPDSWSILKASGLEIDIETRTEFDEILGPAVRQFTYYHIFTSAPDYYRDVQSCTGVRLWLFDLCESFLQVKKKMTKLMNLTPTGAQEAALTIRGQLAKVGAVLENHPYLGTGSGGQTFGGADVAFCSLIAWYMC